MSREYNRKNIYNCINLWFFHTLCTVSSSAPHLRKGALLLEKVHRVETRCELVPKWEMIEQACQPSRDNLEVGQRYGKAINSCGESRWRWKRRHTVKSEVGARFRTNKKDVVLHSVQGIHRCTCYTMYSQEAFVDLRGGYSSIGRRLHWG